MGWGEGGLQTYVAKGNRSNRVLKGIKSGQTPQKSHFFIKKNIKRVILLKPVILAVELGHTVAVR